MKKYYNLNTLNMGLFKFMERWFKGHKILKKCKICIKNMLLIKIKWWKNHISFIKIEKASIQDSNHV